jgi:TnsA endonuclease N terminal
MAKHRWRNTERRIAKLVKEGRGAGSGPTYLPWIKIHDFSSLGRVHRCVSAKSGREMHLLSDGESDLFLQLDASPLVADIREQFPLDRASTIVIAEDLGHRHPMANGVHTVMTTDLLVTWAKGGLRAIAVKTPSDLEKRRVHEKLEIERVYWERRDVPWSLYVALEPARDVRLNHQEVAEWRAVDDLVDGGPEWDRRAAAMIVELATSASERLVDVCMRAERAHGWQPGVGISACKRLMALGHVRLAEGVRFDPRRSALQLELVAGDAS